jgi:hypothetical protein
VGQNFNGDEARRLVMQWCIDGIGLTNREEHMKIKPPQTYTLSAIPSQHELLELVNRQPLAWGCIVVLLDWWGMSDN